MGEVGVAAGLLVNTDTVSDTAAHLRDLAGERESGWTPAWAATATATGQAKLGSALLAWGHTADEMAAALVSDATAIAAHMAGSAEAYARVERTIADTLGSDPKAGVGRSSASRAPSPAPAGAPVSLVGGEG